jgi:hypothetical protein
MARMKKTVSFGGHGWSHGGIDLPSKLSKPWMEFATSSMSAGDARRAWDWFFATREKPPWILKLEEDLGRTMNTDEMLAMFRPGNFVVKFNGRNLRVGFAPAIR